MKWLDLTLDNGNKVKLLQVGNDILLGNKLLSADMLAELLLFTLYTERSKDRVIVTDIYINKVKQEKNQYVN